VSDLKQQIANITEAEKAYTCSIKNAIGFCKQNYAQAQGHYTVALHLMICFL